jgi:hypothetical protein
LRLRLRYRKVVAIGAVRRTPDQCRSARKTYRTTPCYLHLDISWKIIAFITILVLAGTATWVQPTLAPVGTIDPVGAVKMAFMAAPWPSIQFPGTGIDGKLVFIDANQPVAHVG